MLLRPHLALAVALGVGFFIPTGRAEAQFLGGGTDPFSLYFGYYLPHQAYIAAQPTPLDTINRITAERQFSAITDRAGLYDPISPYGTEETDPLAPYTTSRKGERIAKPSLFATSTTTSNARGTGPALYYTRTARYYPSIRVGQSPNKNLGVHRSSRGGFSGGMGMGGFGGPR